MRYLIYLIDNGCHLLPWLFWLLFQFSFLQHTNAFEKDRVDAIFPGYADNVSLINFAHYSGYLDDAPLPNGVHLHYVFYESQRNERDPLVLWLNGGPGCSSLLGALTELGPFRLQRDGRVVFNRFAWNRAANLLVLSSPVGVGFSFREDSRIVQQDDAWTAKLNFNALKVFYRKFPQFATNDFYIAGESYGGIYIPMLSELVMRERFPSKFKGISTFEILTLILH